MMPSYNTNIYSPSCFKRALYSDQNRPKHAGVTLHQVNQISVDEENSALDMNIHYSQYYEEFPSKKHSLIKFGDSPICDPKEFEEEIAVNHCNLNPKADTLIFNEERTTENLRVPEMGKIFQMKNLTENSIEDESIGTFTSPCFQTSRIGTNGGSSSINGENIDLNAQLTEIQLNSYLRTLKPQKEINNDKANENQIESISDRIWNTNRNSYRSLSNLEMISKRSLYDDNKTFPNHFQMCQENKQEAYASIKKEESNNFETNRIEINETRKQTLKSSDSYDSLVLNAPLNLESSPNYQSRVVENLPVFHQESILLRSPGLKKITELNEDITDIKTTMNNVLTIPEKTCSTLPSEKVEINEKPTVFCPTNRNLEQEEHKIYDIEHEELNFRPVCNNDMKRNLEKLEENLNNFKSVPSLDFYIQKHFEKQNQTIKIDEGAYKLENDEFINSNLMPESSKSKSIHLNKIANSFNEIAATVSETINRHKKEVEKDCDLSFFKNFLTKIREHSQERLSRKLMNAENFTEPDEKVEYSVNNDFPHSYFYCKTPNVTSYQKENLFSNKDLNRNQTKYLKKIIYHLIFF